MLEHPEILVEIRGRSQIIYETLSKLTPWERLDTGGTWAPWGGKQRR